MGRAREVARWPNAPAFSAISNAATALPTGVGTKVNFQVEDFDTNSNFASSRFTPTVAGYYQINASVQFSGSSTNPQIHILKNGAQSKSGVSLTGSFTNAVRAVNCLIYMNGTTDYLEVSAYHATGSSVNTVNAAETTRFDGHFVRPV